MSNETKKFAGLEALQTFLEGCKTLFASITHKHTLSDISDYTVDTELSSTSANPVQNKVINEEFEAVATAMGVLESAIDDKLDTATASSTYETKEDAQTKYDTITNAKADLNQNDETAIDYVKNRTHWIEQGTEVCLIPAQSFSYPSGESSSTGYRYLTVESTVELSLDKTYKVVYNGITYERCKCLVDFSPSGNIAIVVPVGGNGTLSNSVCIAQYSDTEYRIDVGFGVISQTDANGSHTIAVYEVSETVHKLNEVFIPDTIARTEDIASTYALKTDLENIDLSGYETTENAQSKLDEAKEYTDNKTADMVTSTIVDNKISTHNTATDAHNDIRDLIDGLSTRLNALADSDDETLDQMSEIVEYIKANKALIDSVTTSKVSVSDIVDNLTTNVSNKPLSAAQGVAIKALIDALDAELDSHTHEISDVTNLQSTLDGKASKSVATISSDGLMSAEDKIQLDNGGNPIVTTSGDGAAYTATIDGITALTTGMKITIIPHVVSTTTTPTLNVNGLGAKTIRMPVTYNTGATSGGAIAAWLTKSRPVTLQYNGTYWLTVDLPRASALYLNGVVPVANGGTGATTAEDALTNLGVTATATELNYMDGVTRNVQEQLNEMFSSTATRTANTVLAAPVGADGVASFRKLVATDLPDTWSYNHTLSTNLNTVGWYRIYTSKYADSTGMASVNFTIGHAYYYNTTEVYDFSVSVGYNGDINITQLSGVGTGRAITKIRVVWKASSIYYIDFYYASTNNNSIYVHGSGGGTFCTPTAATVPDGYSTVEFDTTTGCKSSSGFTGNLTGDIVANTVGQTTTFNNTGSDYSYAYYSASGTPKASTGYYQGLAYVSNEISSAGYARIGIADDGTPQYRSGTAASSAQTLIHTGNIGSQSVNYATNAGNAATATHASNGHYYSQSGNSGYYKIKINSTASWMFCFTIRVYQGYRATDIMVSGYNYGQYYWHDPSAVLMSDSDDGSINVYFGYDSAWNLWVGIPASDYTGLDIFNVTNGYTQVSHENLFTITHQSSLTGTIQATQTIHPPYHQYGSKLLLNGTSYGTSLPAAGTVGRIFFKKV